MLSNWLWISRCGDYWQQAELCTDGACRIMMDDDDEVRWKYVSCTTLLLGYWEASLHWMWVILAVEKCVDITQCHVVQKTPYNIRMKCVSNHLVIVLCLLECTVPLCLFTAWTLHPSVSSLEWNPNGMASCFVSLCNYFSGRKLETLLKLYWLCVFLQLWIGSH